MRQIRLTLLAFVLAACTTQSGGSGGAGEPTVAAPNSDITDIQALTDCAQLQDSLDASTQAAVIAATAEAAQAAQARAAAARKRMQEVGC